jgi:hypothetical protein
MIAYLSCPFIVNDAHAPYVIVGILITTMHEDFENRSPDIRWPKGFSPEEADLFAHNQMFIAASPGRVWQHLVEAPLWPRWYPNSHSVRLADGSHTLKAGSAFSWTTLGLDINSHVVEFEPYRRLSWFGYLPGEEPSFCHAWHLIPQDGGTLVVTDEVAKGPLPRKVRDRDEGAMHRAHEMWLAVLRWYSERT